MGALAVIVILLCVGVLLFWGFFATLEKAGPLIVGTVDVIKSMPIFFTILALWGLMFVIF